MANGTQNYNTLEDIRLRKDELKGKIHKRNEQIGDLWSDLVTPKPASNRGELAANIIGNCITAFDTFMLVRKLMNRYGNLFGHRKRRNKR